MVEVAPQYEWLGGGGGGEGLQKCCCFEGLVTVSHRGPVSSLQLTVSDHLLS